MKADHHPGDEAVQVNILVSETCIGATYPTPAFSALVTQRMTQEAHTHLGEGYTMQGTVQASVTQVTQRGNEIVLQVSCVAMWGYSFPQQQQVQIKQQVAGKSKAQAIAILLHTPGVQTVSLESASVPTDVNHIHLVLVAM